ncbi:hypothetical protein AB0M00_26440 [Streptomyces chartreusis]
MTLGDVSAQVEIQAGPFRVAMVSRESAEDLRAQQGRQAVSITARP